MSHQWEITWKGFSGESGVDVVIAPTLNEALTIWQVDQQALGDENEPTMFRRYARVVKLRWKRACDPTRL